MNVSEITNERLESMACGAVTQPWSELKALARAELSRREKVEKVVPDKPCEQCAHGGIEIHPRKHGLVYCHYKSQTKSHHGTCSDWKAKSEKAERPEIEPLPFLNDRTDDLPIVIRRMNMFIHCMQGLINRLEAVERKGT
jgi:hypothetical protein